MFNRPKFRNLPAAVPDGVSRADIVAGLEMILGRSPDAGLVDYHVARGFKDRFELGGYLLSTEEFRNRNRQGQQRQPIFLGDRLLAFTSRDLPIYLVPDDLDITPPVLLRGSWEPHVARVIAGSINPGDVAIDIGSNVGAHTLVMGERVGAAGVVHAFEANPAVMKLLRATMFINHFSTFHGGGRVRLHACAVSDRAGSLVLQQAPGHSGSGHLVTDAPSADFGAEYSSRVEVPTVAIDALLGDTIPELNFLHMDIEGAEPLAVRGARALIARSPALRIVCEWSVGMMHSLADVQDHVDWLVGEGFRFWRLEHSDRLEPVATADLLQQPHCDMFVSRQDPPAF